MYVCDCVMSSLAAKVTDAVHVSLTSLFPSHEHLSKPFVFGRRPPQSQEISRWCVARSYFVVPVLIDVELGSNTQKGTFVPT